MPGTRFSKPLTLLAAGALALGVTATDGGGGRPPRGQAAPRRAARAGRLRARAARGDQARDLHAVRQHALHQGQPERPERPAADAQPARLHHRPRHADHPRAHAADRAHRGRHRHARRAACTAASQGIPIANEYNYYKPAGTTDTAGSFAYWTDPIVDYDTGLAASRSATHTPTMVGANGKHGARAVGALHPGRLQLRHRSRRPTPSWRTRSPTCRTCTARTRRRPRRRRTPTCRTRRRPTSWAWPCTVPAPRRSARLPRSPARPCCPTSPAATTATARCSATSSSSR